MTTRAAQRAATKPHRYIVRGRGDFPIDMLRYDRATPFSESDSGSIVRTFGRDNPESGWIIEIRQAVGMPTTGRWESFGWTVSEVAECS